MERGWTNVPKNQTDVKKIVERLLTMRKLSDSSKKYELDQNRILDMLSNVWGYPTQNKVVHFNDRLRLFGLIMTIPCNRLYYERLEGGGGVIQMFLMMGHFPQNRYIKNSVLISIMTSLKSYYLRTQMM